MEDDMPPGSPAQLSQSQGVSANDGHRPDYRHYTLTQYKVLHTEARRRFWARAPTEVRERVRAELLTVPDDSPSNACKQALEKGWIQCL